MEHDWFETDPPEAAACATEPAVFWGWEELFVKALQNNDPQTLHRAFKRWKSTINIQRKEDEIDAQKYGPEKPTFHLGFLALKNPSSSSVSSAADLDAEGARLLEFVQPIARAWRIGVFVGKIKAMWHGVRECSPNRLSLEEREATHLVSRYYCEKGSGEPPKMLHNAIRELRDFTDDGAPEV